jgi:hypothetical protein
VGIQSTHHSDQGCPHPSLPSLAKKSGRLHFSATEPVRSRLFNFSVWSSLQEGKNRVIFKFSSPVLPSWLLVHHSLPTEGVLASGGSEGRPGPPLLSTPCPDLPPCWTQVASPPCRKERQSGAVQVLVPMETWSTV